MNKWITFFIILISFFLFSKLTIATEDQFITLVNPVRISSYSTDPKASILSQYQVLSKRNLPATWLLTFDALSNKGVIEIIKQMSADNESGIFLEITENFAKATGINYNKTDSWHRANSVLTTGYSQQNRIKLIDTVFGKYKEAFGNYPKSVGAWWIDSYSLEYMVKKFGITANLTVADQFSTDGYGIWGQYFSTPYYPSRLHAGMPASTEGSKLKIVTMQWAPRDPLNSLGISAESLYSSQDYQLIGLPNSFYEKLIALYSEKHRNSFGQIVLGLEANLSPEVYKGLFSTQMDIVDKLNQKRGVRITTMKQFSDWYQDKFPQNSPSYIIETDDLLGKNKKVIWYQSPRYRIGLIIEPDITELRIINLRTYYDNFQEPYYLSPNKQLELYIRNPSILDNVQNKHSFWALQTGGKVKVEGSTEKLTIKFPKGEIILTPISIIFSDSIAQQDFLDKSNLFKEVSTVQGWEYQAVASYPYQPSGLKFKDLPAEVWYFTNSENLKKPANLKRIAVVVIFVTFVTIIIYFRRIYRKKFVLTTLICLGFSGCIIILINLETYFVSQAELDTLQQLKAQPEGKVIVLNQDCLRCKYTSPFRPAVFANRRGYIKKITGKEIIYNRSIFTASDRPSGKKQLDKLKARYIYVVKYEDYVEQVPFSPGDYNLDLIYENANSQLWKIKTQH